jgi:hypothetical protein
VCHGTFSICRTTGQVVDHIGHEPADAKAATTEAMSFANLIPGGAKVSVKDDIE